MLLLISSWHNTKQVFLCLINKGFSTFMLFCISGSQVFFWCKGPLYTLKNYWELQKNFLIGDISIFTILKNKSWLKKFKYLLIPFETIINAMTCHLNNNFFVKWDIFHFSKSLLSDLIDVSLLSYLLPLFVVLIYIKSFGLKHICNWEMKYFNTLLYILFRYHTKNWQIVILNDKL